MTRYIVRAISILLLIFFAVTFKDFRERNKEHKRLCTVLKHYQSNTVYKSNITDNFILILKVRNDTVFKNTFYLDVSPSTYYDCKDNENWYFLIRNEQIKSSINGNLMSILTLMSLIIGIILLIGTFINFED
jgi:hypothetical protein